MASCWTGNVHHTRSKLRMDRMLGSELIKRIQELGEDKDVVIEDDGWIGEIIDSNLASDQIQLSVWYD